jgi:hypothetical protein
VTPRGGVAGSSNVVINKVVGNKENVGDNKRHHKRITSMMHCQPQKTNEGDAMLVKPDNMIVD